VTTASPPSTRRNLCVVARRRRQLYEYLSVLFAERPDIEIILDRRLAPPDRRLRHLPTRTERRMGQRRVGRIAAELDRQGFAVLAVWRPRRGRGNHVTS
jgi:hypothetical protein